MPNSTTLAGWVEWDQQRALERWELANGQLVQCMTGNGAHQAIVANLLDQIRPSAKAHGCSPPLVFGVGDLINIDCPHMSLDVAAVFA